MRIIFIVLLFISVNTLAQTSSVSMQETFKNYVGASQGKGNGSMVNYTIKEETEGSPYLFSVWANGVVHLKNGTVLTEPTQSLNFSKMDNHLIVNLGNNKILSMDMNDIDLFTLKTDSINYNFEKVTSINAPFAIAVFKDSAYSLYEVISTKFYASDYENKGLYEKGYKYDRYVDTKNYYIVSHDGVSYDIHSGSKKDLKKIEDKIPKLKNFLSTKSNLPGEDYLKSAVQFINK